MTFIVKGKLNLNKRGRICLLGRTVCSEHMEDIWFGKCLPVVSTVGKSCLTSRMLSGSTWNIFGLENAYPW
jgi:hypothetical protein